MSKTTEIENEIWAIWQILITAKECFQYSFYLHKPETKEEQDYLASSPDFEFIRHMLWRMMIIELAKLFSNSKERDRFNISHFIKKLHKNGYFGKIGINELTIKNWENEILNNMDIIAKIITLRDKVYAHTDSNKENYTKGNLTFQQIEKLLKIIENVIQEIYSTVFKSDASMDTPFFNRNSFSIIRSLASEHNRRIKNLLS